tara:strand:- start:2052 stop:4478 length:2427 start_codon:yes stop_codon:yes gene_type:complete
MSAKWIIFAFLVLSVTAEQSTLKSQRATDIAGKPTHFDGYNQTADVPHISFDAYQHAEEATQKFVRKMLVDGLREQFTAFKQSFTQFADDEGFVREGISYCGAPSPEANGNVVPVGYKSNTGRLIENDGVGDSEAFEEANICSSIDEEGILHDHCDENSIVGSLARIVRGLGLNVHHQDICNATINSTLSDIKEPDVFTTTLKTYPGTRYERSCVSKKKSESSNGRFFERNSKCFGTREADCEDKCRFFGRENTCFSLESHTGSGGSDDQCASATQKQQIDPVTELQGGQQEYLINSVRRATSYGLTQLAVESTDYAFVTGCEEGHCNSFRSVLAALNGNAQVNAFRDLGIEESGEHWLNEIGTIKGYLVDFAYQLTNFRDLSLEIFPYIEDEEIEGCPMGETKYEAELTGTEEEPLCYQKNLDDVKLNKMDKTGQSFSRTKCLCRNGQLGRSMIDDDTVPLPNAYGKVERDDLYLAIDNSTDCDAADVTLPASVYTFCKQIQSWGDQPAWRQTLESLQPDATKSRIKIYTYAGTVDLADKRQKFVDNVAKTLPSALDTSCGRIVNADHEASEYPATSPNSTVKRSNRGGNCPPFAKLQEVLYRLEFETGARDMGEYATHDDTNPNLNKSLMFKNLYCADGSFSGNAFSFRQLAYKWDGAATEGEDTPKQEDLVGEWFLTHSLSNDARSPRYTQRYIEGGQVTDEKVGDAEFCHPHWVYQIGGDVGRTDGYGMIFEDPYILLREEIQEAVFNTKLAQAAKTQVREQNAVLWRYIEAQLTENLPGTVVDHLGAAAGKHYMRIWIDEHTN